MNPGMFLTDVWEDIKAERSNKRSSPSSFEFAFLPSTDILFFDLYASSHAIAPRYHEVYTRRKRLGIDPQTVYPLHLRGLRPSGLPPRSLLHHTPRLCSSASYLQYQYYMAVISVVEGTIPFIVNGEAFNTYHKVVGALEGRTKRPLVVLHGGPAFSHDYLIPLGDLAAFGRPVIFYDQIGSGRSAPTKDQLTTFWTMDLFIDELINLVQHLKIDDDFDVLGHSWGGILLSEFILRRGPPGLKHAVLTNTLCSTQVFGESRMQQGKAFPAWVQEEMKKGFRNTPEFREVAKIFSRVHQCRIEPQPEEFTTSVEYGFQNVHVLHSM
jgi:proline-specific peptidase